MRRVSSCRRRKGECLGQGSLATGRARSLQVELKGAALACFEMRPEAEERESGHLSSRLLDWLTTFFLFTAILSHAV